MVSQLIPASVHTDMVEDPARGLLYITAGNQVLRYDLTNRVFLPSFNFGTNLCSLDISPDNNTLIVADQAAYNGTQLWAYVVNLPSGAVSQALFASDYYEGGRLRWRLATTARR